jgi:cytochrome c5
MKFALTGTRLLGFGIASLACLAAPAFAADGKAVYDKTCVVCHATGVANAPKLGDKAAWAPRVATGKDALLSAVVKGKGAMPPNAGAADLSPADIQAAIDYMLAATK